MSDAARDWGDVAAEVRRVISESAEPFDAATVANAGDILSALRGKLPIPEVFKGYWPTIRFCWTDCASEIEVFSDHVELYLFRDLRTDIRHYDHSPGKPLSGDLSEALTALHGKSD